MSTLSAVSAPHKPLPEVERTPVELEAAAIERGADPTAVRALRRAHQHSGFINCVRDLAVYTAALDALAAASEAAVEPNADLSAPPAPLVLPPAIEPAATLEPLHPVLRLWDAGFGPEIIPIKAGAKVPSIPGWQRAEITREMIVGWIAKGRSFGLRTRHFPSLDADVLRPDLSAAIEEVIVGQWGSLPKRTGLAPKFAIPFRAESPFKKLVLTLRDADSRDLGKVEALGDGQQYVISGPHPSGSQYSWSHNGQRGEVEILAAAGAKALPLLTPDDIKARLLPALTAKLAPFGVTVTLGQGGGAVPGAVDQTDLLAPSLGALQEVIAATPNELEVSREDWIAMGHAIAASGADWPVEAFEVWTQWSEKWPGHNSPEAIRAAWESFHGPFTLGWQYLLSRARDGVSARYEFSAVEVNEAPAPTPVGAQLPEAADEGEQIAALLHDASPAFLFEVPSLADGGLFGRWGALRSAALLLHPDESFFLGEVVPVAAGLRSYRKLPQFSQLLGSHLRKSAAWTDRTPARQQALLRAAFVLVIGPVVSHPLPKRAVASGPLRCVVERLLPSTGAALIVGPSNTGKSFVALDLAGRVAAGTPTFAGLPVRRTGAAFYFSSEDSEGLVARVGEWATAHTLDASRLHVYDAALNLSDFGSALEGLQAALDEAGVSEAPAVVVIDTLRDALGGADENDAAVMATALLVARTLSRMLGSLCGAGRPLAARRRCPYPREQRQHRCA